MFNIAQLASALARLAATNRPLRAEPRSIADEVASAALASSIVRWEILTHALRRSVRRRLMSRERPQNEKSANR
jgi:hypothetical protein